PHPQREQSSRAPSPHAERGGGAGDTVGALLAAPGGDTSAADTQPKRTRDLRHPVGNPWVAGLLALLLAIVLGNLGTVRVFVTNVAKLGGYERPALYDQMRRGELERERLTIYNDYYNDELDAFEDEMDRAPQMPDEIAAVTAAAQDRTADYITEQAEHPYLWDLWRYELQGNLDLLDAFREGLKEVVAGKDLPMATHRWYWAPTRVISELPNGAGNNAIAEMPYFTFLYGDLHAHMMAFPITLLVLLWLLAEIIGAGQSLRTWYEAGIALVIGAIAVGVLRPTNSWDWITYLLLGGAGLTYVAWIDASRVAEDRPLSPAFEWLWDMLSPGQARRLWVLAFAIPLGLVARIMWYLVQKMRLEQQQQHGLAYGEEWIDPALTISSALVWAVGALGLVSGLYVVLLIAFKARINRRVLVGLSGRVGGFVALTFIAALPFTMYFATAYNSISPWEKPTTPLWAYLYVFGTFIFIVISFLIWQTARLLRSARVRDLRGLGVPVTVIGGGLLLIVAGSIVVGARDVPVMQLTVPLIAWAGLLFFMPRQAPLLRAVHAIIVLALAISLGVELIVLDGDIGRQNTVFKFYLQVWFMLSIVGGVVLAWMLHQSWRWGAGLRMLWQTGLALLFSLALLYPLVATQARFLDRFNKDETPLTLDGMDYMQYAVHGEHELWFPLQGDYDMIRWLQDNVEGTPVIAEAHLYPSEYHWGGRISIYTGLPTLLGWRFHQIQQHSLQYMNLLVQTRENNAAAFYELSGPEGIRTAMNLSAHYDIEYIVVGALERAFYGDVRTDPDTLRQTAGHAPGLAKLDAMVDLGLLEVVYNVPRCLDYGTKIEECSPDQVYHDKIYRFVPGAEYDPAVWLAE
ncbi:MAG: DUF2298 domain-containing protein, partial [Anaerolineae bacterium]|nr:DUF2298 domain-containing protein [Anaerolineae bacterium]